MPSMTHGIDEAMLQAALANSAELFSFEHLKTCSSTNSLLLERASLGAVSGLTLLTDQQTAGRGRRGRTWFSVPEYSLTFSLLWRFGSGCKMTGLSLAVGLATAQALEDLGFEGIGLKWPNDIWLYGRKLGGVLIELLFDEQGFQAIIGIGLNLRMHPDWATQIDQAATALEVAAILPPREILLGTILRNLARTLQLFEQQGFSSMCEGWNYRNALRGLPVRVSSENGEHRGQCGKAQDDGTLELRLSCGAHLQISGGDVSLCLDTTSIC